MEPPGIIVNMSPDYDRIYIGSPSLTILPDRSYVASHDFFGPGTSFDTTTVFRSTDRGRTWEEAATLKRQLWSRLFVVDDDIYILGTDGRWGSLVLRRSRDGGVTWTEPRDGNTGVIQAADDAWLHGIASGAMLEQNGRLYKAAVRRAPGPRRWGQAQEFVVLSAQVGADLLKASSWQVSSSVSSMPHHRWKGFLTDEGNIVADRDGRIYNIMRVHEPDRGGIAGMLAVSDGGKTLTFDREEGYFPFPGGCKKFTIRYDAKSDRWWSLTNWAQEESRERAVNSERTRNTLALTSAKTLDTWQVRSVILYHPDVRKVGFQYADWHFEGDDIVAVSRTAYGNASNCHDANYLTFHRIKNFRDRTMEDSPLNAVSEKHTAEQSLGGDFGTRAGRGFLIASRLTLGTNMEPLMRAPEIDPSEFFRLIGKALVAVQVLEYSLCHYLAIWAHESPEQARALLEESLKKTFGQLPKALGKHGLVSDSFDERLERFRNERNWFVHRLYAEDWYDLYHPGKAEAMRTRVQTVHAESKALQKVFDELNEQWCLANGATPKELDQAYKDVFAQVMRPHRDRDAPRGPPLPHQ